jgi:hypothetical protein
MMLREKKMANITGQAPGQSLDDIGKFVLPLLLQSAFSGKPIESRDFLAPLLQGLTGQPITLPAQQNASPFTRPELSSMGATAGTGPNDLLATFIPFLVQRITGQPIEQPRPVVPPVPIGVTPPSAIEKPSVQIGGLASALAILGQIGGVLPASVGPNATTGGILTTAIPVIATLLGTTGIYGQIGGALKGGAGLFGGRK